MTVLKETTSNVGTAVVAAGITLTSTQPAAGITLITLGLIAWIGRLWLIKHYGGDE